MIKELLNWINRRQIYKHYKYYGPVHFKDKTEYLASIICHGRNKREAIKNLKKDNPLIASGTFNMKYMIEIQKI